MYWEAREALYDKTLLKAQKQLSKEYVRMFKKTKRELIDLYNEIAMSTADGTLLVSDLYKYNKYYDFLNTLNNEMVSLGNKEITVGEKFLTDLYLNNANLIDKELGFSIYTNPQDAVRAINSVWCKDGNLWSDRIWANKAQLEERVKNGIVDCIARGDSKDRLVIQLQNDFNVGFNQADRIARTELSYVQTQSTIDKYKQAGIEYYEVLGDSDDEECSPYIGEKIRIEDAVVGETLPPFHPNCRCTVLAVLD